MSKFTTRRRFLVGSAVALTAGAAYTVRWQRGVAPDPLIDNPIQNALRSIVDTIVPEDETVGAISLGIDAMLGKEMQDQPKTQALVGRLVDAVNKRALSQHQKAFNLLNIDQREELLLSLLKRSSPQATRFDLQKVRSKVLMAFYTSSAGQRSINYLSPNQYANYALLKHPQSN